MKFMAVKVFLPNVDHRQFANGCMRLSITRKANPFIPCCFRRRSISVRTVSNRRNTIRRLKHLSHGVENGVLDNPRLVIVSQRCLQPAQSIARGNTFAKVGCSGMPGMDLTPTNRKIYVAISRHPATQRSTP